VPSDRTNAGDPDRTLALLWRDPSVLPRRGPRQGLTLDQVLDAATAIADEQGLAALSMRRVADVLGVAVMTLYTYVPAKAELLDLMLDAVYLAMDRTDTTGRPWRERVSRLAEENRALYQAHPWATAVSTHRPSLGPGQMAKYDHELHALDDLGLDDLQRDDALSHVLTFVRAHAQASEDARRARDESKIDDQQWWEINEPLLRRVFDPTTYPLAVRVGTAVGTHHGSAWDPDHAWTFGLARTLDGLSTLLENGPSNPL
jgi:AcrR family transcriptional regulator